MKEPEAPGESLQYALARERRVCGMLNFTLHNLPQRSK